MVKLMLLCRLLRNQTTNKQTKKQQQNKKKKHQGRLFAVKPGVIKVSEPNLRTSAVSHDSLFFKGYLKPGLLVNP